MASRRASSRPHDSRRFVSPMPKWEDDGGPDLTPIWQPALAALAALASVTFAVLLYQKL